MIARDMHIVCNQMSKNCSDGIIDINEMMLQTKAARQMFTQSLHAVALSCMMTTGKIGSTAFARQMHGRF
ncbi:hypothetical protein D3C81_1802690 [compost metagenome]